MLAGKGSCVGYKSFAQTIEQNRKVVIQEHTYEKRVEELLKITLP